MIYERNMIDLFKGINEITIVGYYGVNNFGDDLMLVSLIDMLLESKININIISYGEIPGLSNRVKVDYWTRSNPRENFKMFKKLTRKSDLIIWGGGTCFTDEEGDGLFKYMIYSKLFRNKKIGYISVGIGNITKLSSMIKTRLLLNIADFVSLREEFSYSRAKRWTLLSNDKITLTSDLAKSTLKKEEGSDPAILNHLLISWRNLDSYPNKYVSVESLSDWCTNFAQKNEIKKIILIDADSSVDKDINKSIFIELKNKLPHIEIVHNNAVDYLEKLKIIKECRYVVTSRLHVAMAAYHLGSICYIYEYSPKMSYFFAECNSDKIIQIKKLDVL